MLNLNGPKIRAAITLLCAAVSFRLYRVLVHLVPKTLSAEPTYANELISSIKPITHDTLESIDHRVHGFAYTFEFMACCIALFAVYWIVVRMAKGPQPGWLLALMVAPPVLFMAVMLYTPAMLSSDVYAYSHYGRMLAVLGMDPHGLAPVGGPIDPYSLNGYYDWVPSVYGPLWTVISAGFVMAARSQLGLTVMIFRLLEAVSVLGCGGLIWAILRELAPKRAAQGTLLFLWNPLVVMESALGGHNDTFMMLLALLAVWLHLRGWKAGAAVALALSALVKVITWPLVPLYVLMVLRKSAGWKQGAWFLCRAGLGTAAAVALSMFGARMNPNGLTTHLAGSAQFYENNYHELLFKGLRRLLGEPADSLNAPMDFQPWWVAAGPHAVLHAGVAKDTPEVCSLKTEEPMLVLSDEDSDEWLRVYDPAHKAIGYIDWKHAYVIDEPPFAASNPTIRRISSWPPDWPTVVMANRLIRIVTWSLFVGVGLLAAWRTKDIESFIFWSTTFFIASQLLVFTKIWPWYAIWPLAYGALRPARPATRLAILLSAGMILLYPLLDYCTSRYDWVYDYRSIPTIVLPAVIFFLLQLARSFWSRARESASVPVSTPEPTGTSLI